MGGYWNCVQPYSQPATQYNNWSTLGVYSTAQQAVPVLSDWLRAASNYYWPSFYPFLGY
jgi:hypothetical protein